MYKRSCSIEKLITQSNSVVCLPQFLGMKHQSLFRLVANATVESNKELISINTKMLFLVGAFLKKKAQLLQSLVFFI